jgi:hypothetical protein
MVPCSHVDLARALLRAAQLGANIVNISGGHLQPSGTAHPILADAVRHCAENGILIVAATGNEGCECLNVPAALPSVLAVGAMTSEGEPLELSNWGDPYLTHGILAPGQNILGAAPGGLFTINTGTSYATAIVSGVASLLISLALIRGKRLAGHAVRQLIIDTASGCEYADDADCRRVLAGRLNIRGALSMIEEGREPNDVVPEPAPRGVVASSAADNVLPSGQEVPLAHSPDTLSSLNQVRGRVAEAVANGPVTPAGCGCDIATSPQQVYALGLLSYDFGTEARRDSIVQNMDPSANNPHDPSHLLSHLEKFPSDAAAIVWTMNLDATPIYAIQPAGPFAREAYDRLRQFLREQLTEGVERVSAAGHIVGSVRLFTGQTVPVIHPDLRGMFSWTIRALVEAVSGRGPASNASKKDREDYAEKTRGVREFLERVYHELRNLGLTPQERAINAAATNAVNVAGVVEDALKQQMQLDHIEVVRSPICREGSDCWDVKLTFFNPTRIFEQARKVYRFSVDVSDIPVMVGPVRSWFVR